jgi:hypothetical protein
MLFYLLGVPGAGKTSVMRAALQDVPAYIERRPFAWTRYPGGAQLGAERNGLFSGTDVLPLNVQPSVLRWLDRCPFQAIVAEGDRLANGVFFDAVRAQGWKLTVALIEIGPALAATRREVRRAYQSQSWLRGRDTKVRRLASAYADPDWIMSGRDSIDALGSRLRVHPAFRALAHAG